MSIVLAVGTIRLADRVLSDSVDPESNSTLAPFLTCVALVFGALLGFTVVVARDRALVALSAKPAGGAGAACTGCWAGWPKREGWLGEVEGLQVSYSDVKDKLAQLDAMLSRRTRATELGMPSFTSISARAPTHGT